MATTEQTTAGTEVPGHGGGQEGVFPPLDTQHYPSQLLWLAISFGLLYYLMSRVILPRLEAGMNLRSGRIRGDLLEAQRLKEASEKAAAAYEQALADARAKANAIAQGSRDALMKELDGERSKVEADIEARVAAAETRIRDMKTKALSEVEKIAEDVTADVVQRLVGAAPDSATVKRALKAVSGG
jgi:F-type H+-transporting ATPase subunit b